MAGTFCTLLLSPSSSQSPQLDAPWPTFPSPVGFLQHRAAAVSAVTSLGGHPWLSDGELGCAPLLGLLYAHPAPFSPLLDSGIPPCPSHSLFQASQVSSLSASLALQAPFFVGCSCACCLPSASSLPSHPPNMAVATPREVVGCREQPLTTPHCPPALQRAEEDDGRLVLRPEGQSLCQPAGQRHGAAVPAAQVGR